MGCTRRCDPAVTWCSRPATPPSGAGRSGTAPSPTGARTIDGVGTVDNWVDVTDIDRTEPDSLLVSFRWTFVFASDGCTLTSDSTLRFRGRDEVEADLVAHGFAVDDVRDAPDRPGREFVFIARRT